MEEGDPNVGRHAAALFCLLIGFDQLSKLVAPFAVDRISLLRPMVDPTVNRELIFGLDLALPMLIAVPLAVAISWVWSVAIWSVAADRRTVTALSVFWAGMLGNLVDRLILGAVRDWLVLGSTIWNVADFALLWGMFVGVYCSFRSLAGDRDHVIGGEL